MAGSGGGSGLDWGSLALQGVGGLLQAGGAVYAAKQQAIQDEKDRQMMERQFASKMALEQKGQNMQGEQAERNQNQQGLNWLMQMKDNAQSAALRKFRNNLVS